VTCPNHVEYSSGLYIDGGVAACMINLYAQYGNSFYVNIVDNNIVDGNEKPHWKGILKNGCRIEFMYLTSLDVEDGNSNNISCTDIRRMMFYGFELSWLNSLCKNGSYPELDNKRYENEFFSIYETLSRREK
jgi:hypothetical protein